VQRGIVLLGSNASAPLPASGGAAIGAFVPAGTGDSRTGMGGARPAGAATNPYASSGILGAWVAARGVRWRLRGQLATALAERAVASSGGALSLADAQAPHDVTLLSNASTLVLRAGSVLRAGYV
jgi:hypothetical protein